MRTLNLGILAHVDAGKTTLTERLLYAAGAIGKLGSVDRGTTQTDSLALERERGITIRSAVATLAFDDLIVNILDTPGHPDFIAEVERVLSVLDGAVLVVSAVEGVQPQTPLLWRALQRLRVPTIFFINKIDRAGSDHIRTLTQIRERLAADAVLLCGVAEEGTREARAVELDWAADPSVLEQLAERDDGVMAAFVDNRPVASDRIEQLLATGTAAADLQPVLCGSAIAGVGTDELMGTIRRLLPATEGNTDVPASARVFKVERAADGAKAALARVFSGTLAVRERITYANGTAGKIVELDVYEPGGPVQRRSAGAGSVVRLLGLDEIRVGDWIGATSADRGAAQFPPPTLESVVAPLRSQDRARLRTALSHLADQDPLINVRQDAENVFSVALYGEVQKEVIAATLERDYGIAAAFRDSTTICIERPAGVGEAEELLFAKTHTNISGRSSAFSTNPYAGTLALRVEPRPAGTGVRLEVDVGVQLVPLYIYNTVGEFRDQLERYAIEALSQGPYGWRVDDCLVTVTDSGYPRTGSSAREFRLLLGLVLKAAIDRAGTIVCEPYVRVSIELPDQYLSTVMSEIAKLGARPAASASNGIGYIRTGLPTVSLAELRRRLPGLSGGQGTLEAEFSGFEPVMTPEPPRRRPVAV